MGGDRRPLPKCQLEEEEKLPDPSWGSPPNIMQSKDIIKWQRGSEAELLNIWQDQSAFQNAIQKQRGVSPHPGSRRLYH